MKRTYNALTLAVQADQVELRTEKLGGQEHLVVPVVALVEGVVFSSNADAPALALAEEFAKVPEAWNGRPLFVNHPEDAEGNKVSANAVSLWDSGVVGQFFNVALDGKKLKGEMWINKERAGTALLSRFEDNDQLVEVSTGLWCENERKHGKFDGKEYDQIWRNCIPDHLAILSEGSVGACSVADGCGAPRTNARAPQTIQEFRMASDPQANCECKGGDPSVRNQAQATGTNASPESPLTQKALSLLLKFVGLKDRSDNDKRNALDAALNAEREARSDDEPYSYAFVVAVYEDYFVYVQYGWGMDSHMYKRGYSIDDAGKITLKADQQTVRAETEYVPIEVTVEAAIEANQASQPAVHADIPGGSMNQAAQGTGQPNVQAQSQPATPGTTTPSQPASPAPSPNPVPTPNPNPTPSPSNMSAQSTDEAMAYYASRKKQVIENLGGKTDLTANELENMPITVLEKMLKAVTPASLPQVVAQANQPATDPAASAAPQTPAPVVNYQGAAPAPAQSAPNNGQPSYTAAQEAFPRTNSYNPNDVKHGVDKRQRA